MGDGHVVGDGSALQGIARLTETGQLTVGEWIRLIAESCGYYHEFTEDEIEYVLWEQTAYPVAGTTYVQRQLIELFERMTEENQGG